MILYVLYLCACFSLRTCSINIPKQSFAFSRGDEDPMKAETGNIVEGRPYGAVASEMARHCNTKNLKHLHLSKLAIE